MDETLVKQAISGDSDSFERLATELRSTLVSYLYRRLGDLDQAEDLCQETLIQVYSQLKELTDPADFEVWVFRLAHQNCEPYLQGKEPWSVDALHILQNYLLENPGAEKHLQETYFNYEESYTVQDHIDFCFTVLGKSLFQSEQDVFLLREFAGMSVSGISNITGESSEVLEKKLREATEALSDTLAETCSLVKKGAVCTQCRDFGNWLSGPETTQRQIEQLPFAENGEVAENFFTRLELIQDRDPAQATSKKTHQLLMGFIRRALGDKGIDPL